jgi:hypothetical protein
MNGSWQGGKKVLPESKEALAIVRSRIGLNNVLAMLTDQAHA